MKDFQQLIDKRIISELSFNAADITSIEDLIRLGLITKTGELEFVKKWWESPESDFKCDTDCQCDCNCGCPDCTCHDKKPEPEAKDPAPQPAPAETPTTTPTEGEKQVKDTPQTFDAKEAIHKKSKSKAGK